MCAYNLCILINGAPFLLLKVSLLWTVNLGLGDICTETPLGYHVSSTYPEGPEGTVCGSVIQEQKPYYVHILSPSYKEGFISWQNYVI